MSKINVIDLFAGCGGLTEGFEQTGHYNTVACVEWDMPPYKSLLNHMKTKWNYSDADRRILRFDIQRTDELLNGWNDEEYGVSDGLDSIVKEDGVSIDLIIGGPPCQAYSVAGRIRDEHGMRYDYRNYLFESYLEIVKHFRPKAFVFENVPGMLTARPGDGQVLIADLIKKSFLESGYVVLDDLSKAIVDFTEYGVPQKRSRVIILGIRKDENEIEAKELLDRFYSEVLPSFKCQKRTVKDAIGDLPPLYPLSKPIRVNGKTLSHKQYGGLQVPNHVGRFSNRRDIDIFRLLEQDIETGEHRYTTVESLKKLYTEKTGKESSIHKYYVLRWDEQSNTIPAHLYKDGLRHIHPDSRQARSISVREAARLQTFPDDYVFISGSALDYKMIGNAVPPLFAKALGESVYQLLFNKD